MAIEKIAGATVITGSDIGVFRLLALRSALSLESVGLKRRGMSALAIVKSEFPTIKARTAKDALPQLETILRERGILH